MELAIYQYKCRRCGKIDESTESSKSSAHTHLLEAILDTQLSEAIGIRLRLIDICRCDDNGMGISDLIGYKVKKE